MSRNTTTMYTDTVPCPRKFDIIWGTTLVLICILLISPVTHKYFVALSQTHMFLMAFIKFGILATMGELLAPRIIHGTWRKPVGIIWRILIWGMLGVLIALVFRLYSAGVSSALYNGLLPQLAKEGFLSHLSFALYTSVLMNCLFAPTFMAFHRITDAFIDISGGSLRKMRDMSLKEVLATIKWNEFISFVVCKTIPFFWIPAHTITFLLPPEYRVLAAAMLSIALGGILGFAKRS